MNVGLQILLCSLLIHASAVSQHTTQILGRLDIALPAEKDRWWRRHVDGEMPHLCLISPTSTRSSKYRGPLWIEARYTSGHPVTARVFASARGDFLIEMEPRSDGGMGSGSKSRPMLSAGTLLQLEVRAQDLMTIFESVVAKSAEGEVWHYRQRQWLLAPARRAEVCR